MYQAPGSADLFCGRLESQSGSGVWRCAFVFYIFQGGEKGGDVLLLSSSIACQIYTLYKVCV